MTELCAARWPLNIHVYQTYFNTAGQWDACIYCGVTKPSDIQITYSDSTTTDQEWPND